MPTEHFCNDTHDGCFEKRFESPTRYYLVRCARDLFGDLVLSRYWGGLGSRRGGVRHCAMANANEALSALAAIERRRHQHGYQAVIL